MPYDASGNYTRVHDWTDDRDANIKIQAARMDQENDDIAAAFNQVMLRSGVTPMTGDLDLGQQRIVGLTNGTAGNPAIQFDNDPLTGYYLNGTSRFAITVNGTRRFEADTAGVEVVGTLDVSGNATLSGNLDVTGTLAVTGAVTFANIALTGTLDVDGASTLANTTVGGTLGVTGDATFVNVTVGGTLAITGATTATGNVTTAGFLRSSLSGQDVTLLNDGVNSSLSASGQLLIYANGANNIILHTNSTERARVKDAGVDVTGALSVTGSITDSAGNVRRLIKSSETSGVLTSASSNKVVRATGGVTLNNSVFSPNDTVMLINKSGGAITITQGTGVTLTDVEGNTGNRTLANHGIATVWFNAANDAVIFGAGIS